MLYYRVKKSVDMLLHDEKYIYSSNGRVKCTGDSLIPGELYTPHERAKIANCYSFFEPVLISKQKTYFFFGARFPFHNEEVTVL